MVELLGSDFPLPAHVVLPEVISPIQGLGLFLIICFLVRFAALIKIFSFDFNILPDLKKGCG